MPPVKTTQQHDSLCLLPAAVLDGPLTWAVAAAIAWLLLAGVWSSPALGATLRYPNGLLGVEIVLALLLTLLALHGRIPPLRAYPFFLPGLAVLALSALAAGGRLLVFGGPYDALRLWQETEPMARGLLLFLALAGCPRLLRWGWGWLLAGAAVLAVATVVQHFTGVTRWYPDLDAGWASGVVPVPASPYAPRAQGLTSYINLSAALLAASLPLWVMPLLLRRPGVRWQDAVLATGALVTAAALWYTNARGPIIGIFAVGLLVMTLQSWRWGGGMLLCVGAFLLGVWPGLSWWALLTLFIALALGVALRWRRATWLVPIVIGLGLAGGLQVVDAYLLHLPLGWRVLEEGLVDAPRQVIYQELAPVIWSSPWVGVGDARVASRFPYMERTGLRRLPATQRNAHNQAIQWAAAEGIPVALAFTLLVGGAMLWAFRRSRQWPSPIPRAAGLALAAAMAVFLFTNLAEAHFWRSEGAGFFWLLCGMTAAINHGLPPQETTSV